MEYPRPTRVAGIYGQITFKSKAGVAWADRAMAIPGRPKKYAFIEQEVVTAPTAHITAPSALDPAVAELVAYITDGAARKMDLSELGIDVSDGLTRLSDAHLAGRDCTIVTPRVTHSSVAHHRRRVARPTRAGSHSPSANTGGAWSRGGGRSGRARGG